MRAWRVEICAALLCLLGITGCGTPGAPLPPSLNLPLPPDDLNASRKGDVITLAWRSSDETTDNATVRGPVKYLACYAPNSRAMNGCQNATEVSPKPVTPNSRRVFVEVPLPPETFTPNGYAAFAMQLENSSGRSAGLSKQVLVPLEPLDPPSSFHATVGPNGIALNVTVSGTRQPEVRIFRREKGQTKEVQITGHVSAEFGRNGVVMLVDEQFEWEKTYQYRAVAFLSQRLPDGQVVVIESADSPTIEVFAHDVFAPGQPTGLQAVFSGGIPGQANSIDLTWDANLERDLAGYVVYRREEGQAATAATKLNVELTKSPTYRDLQVQAGHRYFYSVSAIDVRGNESRRSAETSEAVPQ